MLNVVDERRHVVPGLLDKSWASDSRLGERLGAPTGGRETWLLSDQAGRAAPAVCQILGSFVPSFIPSFPAGLRLRPSTVGKTQIW